MTTLLAVLTASDLSGCRPLRFRESLDYSAQLAGIRCKRSGICPLSGSEYGFPSGCRYYRQASGNDSAIDLDLKGSLEYDVVLFIIGGVPQSWCDPVPSATIRGACFQMAASS